MMLDQDFQLLWFNILSSFCSKNKIDIISIDTSEEYVHPLEQFFNSRIKRH